MNQVVQRRAKAVLQEAVACSRLLLVVAAVLVVLVVGNQQVLCLLAYRFHRQIDQKRNEKYKYCWRPYIHL